MSSNMERVAAMPDASLYVNRDGERADDCVDSHGGGNLTKIPRSGGGSQKHAHSIKIYLLPHLGSAGVIIKLHFLNNKSKKELGSEIF